MAKGRWGDGSVWVQGARWRKSDVDMDMLLTCRRIVLFSLNFDVFSPGHVSNSLVKILFHAPSVTVTRPRPLGSAESRFTRGIASPPTLMSQYRYTGARATGCRADGVLPVGSDFRFHVMFFAVRIAAGRYCSTGG
eukprot:756668-Hanusia_phi.AAC.2